MTTTPKSLSDLQQALHAKYVAERLSLIEEFLDEHDDETEQLAMLSDYMNNDVAEALAHSPWPSVRKALIELEDMGQVYVWATVAAYPFGAGYDDRGLSGYSYDDDEYNDDHEHKAAGLVRDYAINGDIVGTLNFIVNGTTYAGA